MSEPLIALVGDYDAAVPAHQAIPLALAGRARFAWLATDTLGDAQMLAQFDGIWCVPASPYRSLEGALRAIRHAREQRIPFLGTCGGFQHALIEYARSVLGWADADHAETAPDAPRAVITALQCSLVEVRAPIRLLAGSRIAAAYGRSPITEGYRCRYGLNPRCAAELLGGALAATAFDEEGEVRAVELADHPFFVATLFQPERAALAGERAPLVEAFTLAARQRWGTA